jgi:hypothetical protein
VPVPAGSLAAPPVRRPAGPPPVPRRKTRLKNVDSTIVPSIRNHRRKRCDSSASRRRVDESIEREIRCGGGGAARATVSRGPVAWPWRGLSRDQRGRRRHSRVSQAWRFAPDSRERHFEHEAPIVSLVWNHRQTNVSGAIFLALVGGPAQIGNGPIVVARNGRGAPSTGALTPHGLATRSRLPCHHRGHG